MSDCHLLPPHLHVLAAPHAESVEEGRPVLFFCKAGKDRTGLVAAMLLTLMGAGGYCACVAAWGLFACCLCLQTHLSTVLLSTQLAVTAVVQRVVCLYAAS